MSSWKVQTLYIVTIYQKRYQQISNIIVVNLNNVPVNISDSEANLLSTYSLHFVYEKCSHELLHHFTKPG